MRTPAVIDAHETASQALQAEVARRLALSPRKEVVLYVHGYRNTFADAAMTMGELCHFLGREFVCGIYSWPAGGRRGILFGYNVDYESSVFASEHLRKTIRTIAQTPGLARLHLLAHSRGTDALVTALSDLNMEAYTQQQQPLPALQGRQRRADRSRHRYRCRLCQDIQIPLRSRRAVRPRAGPTNGDRADARFPYDHLRFARRQGARRVELGVRKPRPVRALRSGYADPGGDRAGPQARHRRHDPGPRHDRLLRPRLLHVEPQGERRPHRAAAVRPPAQRTGPSAGRDRAAILARATGPRTGGGK